jgi:sugar phosphate isomerase/epimerase
LNVLFDPQRVSAEQAVERLAAAGFHALDFNFCDWLFEGSPFVGDGWEGWLKGVRRRADALGLHFGQAHGPIFNKFEESDRAKWLTAMSHRSLEGAAILDVRWVVFEPETLPGTFDDVHIEHLKQRNLDWFGALLSTAEKAEVGIAIENCPDLGAKARNSKRWYGSMPEELAELVDAFHHPLVGICWDTGHANIQELDQNRALRILGDRLKATHIQDNNGRSDQHLLPFYGNVDWRSVMEGLRAIDYKGDFTYEVHNSIRVLPDALRDAALRYAVEVGNYLLKGLN